MLRRSRPLLVALILLVSVTARGRDIPFPLPSTIKPEDGAAYQQQLLDWLNARSYVALKWSVDKGIRDTGPWINDVYYGTHKGARIYYSPAVIEWLTSGRKHPIPDGAMIIKEQFDAPAARWETKPPASVSDWTIMIKDAKGAVDGWFWAELWVGMKLDDHQFPYNYPNAGFGIYCTRCHASAEKESTFSALNNIAGFPGEPIRFRVDDSWRDEASRSTHHAITPEAAPPTPLVEPDPTFLATFPSLAPVVQTDVVKLPNETWDHVVANKQMFMTSDQCQSCHSAANGPFGPTMWITNKDKKGLNVSPYTEWRWSPMGLAGRDPIFYAQLDSELSYLDTIADEGKRTQLKHDVVNTCFRCHGVMGKRQHDLDHPGADYDFDYIFRVGSQPGAKYGALSRDGISCASCHRIRRDVIPPTWKGSPLEFFLQNTITGQFQTGPADELFGPFKDGEIVTKPMDNAVGAKPKHDDYMKSGRMCGHCHTIDLPVVDQNPAGHSIEQSTYLEWLNSAYQNEFGTPKATAQTCQDCHMPGKLVNERLNVNVDPVKTRIAIIEDETYPEAEHRLPEDEIRVRYREKDFARHELLGMNGFLLEMFSQFNDVLGVRKSDYMTGSADALQNAQQNLFEQARKRTATIEATQKIAGRTLTADVTVTNLAGHRLPSGVGFRRAFIELLVVENRDGRERLVWSSGRTNSAGVIVDAEGRPLPTEMFTDGKYQPHYEVITSDDQVQIYEELAKNADGVFTTSFIRRAEDVKDNRLQPLGWSKSGPDPSLNGRYLHATFPHGNAKDDPDYADGKGRDRMTYRIALPEDVDPSAVTVRASLYYQNIPPYYLRDRFTIGKGDSTKRLYYIASNLNLEGTPMEGWKILIATTR
ncbi:MAG TPA: cytochrome P460 family protein [Thermoanaerobaculia bacterium]|nr:cytochrome P460 family protein [Thermoanaerobaculia bacterium]